MTADSNAAAAGAKTAAARWRWGQVAVLGVLLLVVTSNYVDRTLLGVLHTDVATSNCAFGAEARTLVVTADHDVLALRW